jgi:hypothetical protein
MIALPAQINNQRDEAEEAPDTPLQTNMAGSEELQKTSVLLAVVRMQINLHIAYHRVEKRPRMGDAEPCRKAKDGQRRLAPVQHAGLMPSLGITLRQAWIACHVLAPVSAYSIPALALTVTVFRGRHTNAGAALLQSAHDRPWS